MRVYLDLSEAVQAKVLRLQKAVGGQNEIEVIRLALAALELIVESKEAGHEVVVFKDGKLGAIDIDITNIQRGNGPKIRL